MTIFECADKKFKPGNLAKIPRRDMKYRNSGPC